jgi:ATP-dependent Clp protease ATP-binding subunit ClpC
LQRALQKYLEEPLAEEVLKGNLKEGNELKVDRKEGSEDLLITPVKQKEAKEVKEKTKAPKKQD